MDIRNIYKSINNRKLILFGTGAAAKRFCSKNFSSYHVNGFFDNNDSVHECLGLPVTVPLEKREMHPEEPYIIVCSAWAGEMEAQLVSLGYEPVKDFINMRIAECIAEAFHNSDHKIAFYLGVCHAESLMRASRLIPEYSGEYTNFIIRTGNMDMVDEYLLEDLIEQSDVIVYEKYPGNIIEKKYKNIPKQQITFPYQCFWGYWPQINIKECLYSSKNKWIRHENYNPLLSQFDCYVDGMIAEKCTEDEILSKITSKSFISKKVIQDNLEKSIKYMKIWEKSTDVKCAEYFRENYRKEFIFLDPVHPSKFALKYCTLQLCDQLKIECSVPAENFEVISPYTKQHKELPVYPCVAEALGLEMIDENTKYVIYQGDQKTTYTFEEFQRAYIEQKYKFCIEQME